MLFKIDKSSFSSFRHPGAAGTVRRLKWEFNSAAPVTMSDNGADIHSAASLLKLYLRELPEPVIPFQHYEEFTTMGLKIQYDPDQAMDILHDKLTQIPVDNYNLLKYLCAFLHDVCQHSEVNRMTDSNVALMFGPNILRTDDDNPLLMLSTADLNTLTVRTFISHYEVVFKHDYYPTSVGGVAKAREYMESIESAETDYLTGSPCSSGLPSPILPSNHVMVSDGSPPPSPLSRQSSNSSVNDEGEKPAEKVGDNPVSFRTNSVSRESRKRLRGFNILSQRISDMSTTDSCRDSHSSVQSSDVNTDMAKLQIASKEELLSEIAALQLENSRLKKVQVSLERLHERQLSTKIKQTEESFNHRISELMRKLEDEKRITNMSVERLSSVQAELMQYQTKYGPLDADESDDCALD